MICPVCESANSVDSTECGNCGKQLLTQPLSDEWQPPLEGLEVTVLDPLDSAAGAIVRLEALEMTQIVDSKGLQVTVEAIEVERTPVEQRLDVPSNWSGGVELDPTRLPDDGVRTAAPIDTGHCPWCGAAGKGTVCDACGRRRSRYSSAPPPAAVQGANAGVTDLCPACFSRVTWGPKCPECGVPLPLRELF